MRSVRAPIAVAVLLTTSCSFVVSLDGLSDGPPGEDGAGPATDGADGAVESNDASPDIRAGDTLGEPVDGTTPDAPGHDAQPPLDAGGETDASTEAEEASAEASIDATADTSGEATIDAPADAPRDAMSDAMNDAPIDSPIDAPGDAPADARDAATPTFCASRSPSPLFCEDFDEGSFTQGWSYVHTVSGSLALDGTDFQSAPAAMIAESNIAGAGTVDVAGYRSFALTGTSSFAGTLDLDLRVDRADADGGSAVLAQLGLLDGTGGGQYFVQLVAYSHGATPLSPSVNEAYFATGVTSPALTHPVTQTLAVGAWTHVTLAVTAPFGGGAGTETLSFDGTQVGSSAITVPVKNFTQVLGVGLTFVKTPSNGWSALYDDVTFDAIVH
jgi:hypothetical protein